MRNINANRAEAVVNFFYYIKNAKQYKQLDIRPQRGRIHR